MANVERTFGDRLARGYQLYEAINNMSGYAPADDDIKPNNFLSFLDSVDAKNNQVASLKDIYSLDVKSRQNIFFNERGIKKRASYVYAYCKSRSDIKKETAIIQRIYRKIQNYKKPQKNTLPTNDNKRITGEQSYGDFIKLLGDLIESLRQITDYNPPNELITIDSLELYRTDMITINKKVGDTIYDYGIAIKERFEMYEQLKDKMLRIKSSVKAQYGINSNEYQTIKGIKV